MILTQIANRYMTDKGNLHDGKHNFTSAYDEVFNNIRFNIRSVLEIGILKGSSIRMWRDYFTNAEIYGIDIHQEYVNGVRDEDRIIAFKGDQSKSLRNIIENIGEFDIIIDDGSHQVNHQLFTFGDLFDKVKPGGFYIIEDLHTSLNSNYTDKCGGYEFSTLKVLYDYEKTNKWKSKFITQDKINYLNENTENVEVYGWENANNKENMSITSIIRKIK